MNTSNIFKKAHALTKATIQTGDSYSATFAICLKVVYAESNQKAIFDFSKRQKMGCTFKTLKNGQKVIEVVVGSEAQKILSEIGSEFTVSFTRSKDYDIRVDGFGKIFDKIGDFKYQYQYVYITNM